MSASGPAAVAIPITLGSRKPLLPLAMERKVV